jgi:hypothetical protein
MDYLYTSTKICWNKKSKLNLTYANSKDFEISQFEKQYFSYTLGFLFVIVSDNRCIDMNICENKNE